jgi:alpha-tubulin suppressor-like RCC1 family protein
VASAGGADFNCALRADGSARCWGENGDGSLGDGTNTNRLTPVAVLGITGLPSADAVAPGTAHTCSVRNDGTVACWGLNNVGQLGNGTTTSSSNPVAAQGITNAVGVASGDSHSCAVIADGTVRCWGNNAFGQLGDGTTTNRTSPVSLFGITNAVAVTAGFVHTCALIADGTARCWGDNTFGKLGDGTTTLQTSPVFVGGLNFVTALGAGSDHTCALRADGTARCWGSGQFGQLGDGAPGATHTSTSPVFVNNLTGAVNLAAGDLHNCVTLSDGTARCWGQQH